MALGAYGLATVGVAALMSLAAIADFGSSSIGAALVDPVRADHPPRELIRALHALAHSVGATWDLCVRARVAGWHDPAPERLSDLARVVAVEFGARSISAVVSLEPGGEHVWVLVRGQI